MLETRERSAAAAAEAAADGEAVDGEAAAAGTEAAAEEEQALAAMAVEPDEAEEPVVEVEREGCAGGVNIGPCPVDVSPAEWSRYRAAMEKSNAERARIKTANEEKTAAKKACTTYTDTLRNCLNGVIMHMSTAQGTADERWEAGVKRFQNGMIHHCILNDHQYCAEDAVCRTREDPHPALNEYAKNLLRSFVLQPALATILKKYSPPFATQPDPPLAPLTLLICEQVREPRVYLKQRELQQRPAHVH